MGFMTRSFGNRLRIERSGKSSKFGFLCVLNYNYFYFKFPFIYLCIYVDSVIEFTIESGFFRFMTLPSDC